MIKNEVFLMSSQERNRLKVLERLLNREITQINAAKMLGLTDRHVRTLIKNYKEHGDKSLISKKRGKKSNRSYSTEFKEKVIKLIKAKYADFGPTFASEKLEELEGIKVHHETLRHWMIEFGLYKPRLRKKNNIHQSRARRECFGELIQIDGSYHDWFEKRADKCCLLVFIDDATSALLYCRFEETETTLGYFRAIKDCIKSYGKPLAYYSDRFGVFRVNQECSGPKTTQFKRAMEELEIESICANSPQAKGKVERANKTLQNRLVKEMRLRNISSIDEANKYLPEFIEKYNEQFAKAPFSTQDLHREVSLSDEELDRILSIQETRKLSNSLECSFMNTLFQVKTETYGRRLRYSNIIISRNTQDIISIWHKEKKLEFEVKDKEQRTKIVDNKNIDKILKELKSPKKHKPAPDHHWRGKFKKKLNRVSQHNRKSLNWKKPEISNVA